MHVQKFFHLDYTPVIPECGYQCPKCIQEICDVLCAMEGVLEVSSGKRGEISGIVVRYDSEITGDEDLVKAFGELPSFYQGRFVPEVMET